MNAKVLKIIGLVLSVAGAAVGIGTDLINDQKMKTEVHNQVAEALAETTKES